MKKGEARSPWNTPLPLLQRFSRPYRDVLVLRRDVLRLLLVRRLGTLAPLARASESPIATACLRLVTLRPPRDRSVPRLERRTALATRRPDEVRRVVDFRADGLLRRLVDVRADVLRVAVRRPVVRRPDADARVVVRRPDFRRAEVRRLDVRAVDLRDDLLAALRAAMRTSPVRLSQPHSELSGYHGGFVQFMRLFVDISRFKRRIC
jgi:hypothetical protein